MTEHDRLGNLLREWPAAEPSAAFDERVLLAYRKTRVTFWHRIWKTRVSVPLPVLVFAAMIVFAVVFWLRSTPPGPPQTGKGIITQVDGGGFQPVPNGEARVISVRDLRK